MAIVQTNFLPFGRGFRKFVVAKLDFKSIFCVKCPYSVFQNSHPEFLLTLFL